MFEPGAEIVAGRHCIERLGGGARFEVYLATDEALAAAVVLKILRPDQAAEPSALRVLRREARRLRTLAHPRIVRLFAAVEDGERPHLVLEYIEGPTLRMLIKRSGRVGADHLVTVGLDLASVLHYLRGAGVVHLDIKPSNVIVGAGAFLVDFSIARPADRAAALGSAVGTAATMAPEQCDPRGRGPVGPPADVWGWGATMWEAASGARAVPGAKQGGPYPQLERRVGRLDHGPEAFRDLVEACLDPDPAARPEPSELLDRLEPLVAGLPARPFLGRRRPKLV